MKRLFIIAIAVSLTPSLIAAQNSDTKKNTADILRVLNDSRGRSGKVPILSPLDGMVGTEARGAIFDVKAIQAAGFPVVIWTVNDSARMEALLERHVDGIISDRPDLLVAAVEKARVKATSDAERNYLQRFDAQAHRGGRDLRPENTLPSFESGLDRLVTTLETDTGVTKDGGSLISHEPFLNPQTCRMANDSPYTEQTRVWIKDVTRAEAQERFICDKVFRGAEQKNDLTLSPVAVAFAAKHQMRSPYAPTYAAQLFEFVDFYVAYYRSGDGKATAEADKRWRNASKVRFNMETKLTPMSTKAGETRPPWDFVNALCGAISAAQMDSRADVQSFDFRTLTLVEKQHPQIRTVYLMESMRWKNATP